MNYDYDVVATLVAIAGAGKRSLRCGNPLFEQIASLIARSDMLAKVNVVRKVLPEDDLVILWVGATLQCYK